MPTTHIYVQPADFGEYAYRDIVRWVPNKYLSTRCVTDWDPTDQSAYVAISLNVIPTTHLRQIIEHKTYCYLASRDILRDEWHLQLIGYDRLVKVLEARTQDILETNEPAAGWTWGDIMHGQPKPIPDDYGEF